MIHQARWVSRCKRSPAKPAPCATIIRNNIIQQYEFWFNMHYLVAVWILMSWNSKSSKTEDNCTTWVCTYGLPLSPISAWPCDQTNVITCPHTHTTRYSNFAFLPILFFHAFTISRSLIKDKQPQTSQYTTCILTSICPPKVHSQCGGAHVCAVTDLWPQSTLCTLQRNDHLFWFIP